MSDLTQKDFERIASELVYPTDAFIGGKFVPSKSGETMETINPATGEVITAFAACGLEDVEEAVAIAKATFESGVWSKMHPTERKKLLLAFADLVEKNKVELSVLEALDSGKPVSEVLNGDIVETYSSIRFHAEYSDKRYGQVSPSGNGALGLVVKEPLGVVVGITPWNFPLISAAWKIAPALSEGNCIIIKPACQTTLSTLFLAKLASEAGIPAGVLQVLPGSGSLVGKALGMHNDVHAVSFTGSTGVGCQLLEYSAQSNLKKVSLELGGKSPFVILDDVKDYSSAVSAALAGAFWNTGQNCTANSRIFVPNARKEEFVELLVAGLAKDWKMGAPLDPSNNLGPMVSKEHFESVMSYINAAVADGTRVATGGKASDFGSFYIEPTVFVDPKPGSDLVTKEIFGPVTCVIGVDSNEEAIELANKTEYGLQATLFTDNVFDAHNYARQMKAGTVSINKYCEGDITTPFGGLKMSGFGGQANAETAHEQYCEIKTIYLNLEK